MARIFDWAVRDSQRLATVASLKQAKGRHGAFAQVTCNSAVEAAAAEAAGIELAVCRAANVAEVRKGSSRLFVTAALGFAEAITDDEILRTAFKALTDGADAVITARRLSIVSLLAAEDIPVMGHLGFVPRKSTWVGSVRAVGKTADEAVELYHRFRRLEEAGAFAVEAELVPAPLMAELSRRSGLVTVSLGSGPAAEVAFLFTNDICGEGAATPRHARKYGDLARLYREIDAERIRSLQAFRADVLTKSFPAANEVATVPDALLEEFARRLDH
ncbi:MAG: 3-methyl-2-oxobutanoate hydroxymethyltransferase [Rhodobacterales bacterium]|nr:3-methyl-2-oxobutanoate hydroxymethyltransferase [Rhodobacterales bacterium]